MTRKSFTAARLRVLCIGTTIAAIVGLLGPVATSTIANSTGAVASAVSGPRWQVCETQRNACMNRKGGSFAYQTPIVGWHIGDRNNGFQIQRLNAMCGRGYVTMSCPAALPARIRYIYFGNPLVIVKNTQGVGCVGSGANGAGKLESCPGIDGSHAGFGTVMIAPQFPHPTLLVDLSWSEHDKATRWVCNAGSGSSLNMAYKAGAQNLCEWEVYSNPQPVM